MITRTISQKPTKIDSEVQADWEENNPNSAAFIRHKPNLAPVATSGDYNDLSNKLQAGDGIAIDGDTIFAKPDNVTVELNNKGELSVIGGSTLQAGEGIEIDQGTIFAKPDNITIDFNEDGQLSVVGGSTLEAGDGIAIDEGTIFARPDNKTIIIDEDGALAAVRNSDDGGTPFEGGGGIEINRSDNTISAKVDNKTIIIDTDGALVAVEGTTLEAGEGISIDQGTIHAKPDGETIDFNNQGELSVVDSSTLEAGEGIDITEKTISVKVDNDTITLNTEGQLTATLPDISRNAVFNAELRANGWDIADLVGKIQETGISTAINAIAAGKGDAWVAAGNDIWYCRDNTFKIWEKATTNIPSDMASPTINDVAYSSELGIFIAVGYKGCILLGNNNASRWILVYMDGHDESTILTGVTYGGGKFVAVGKNGVILTSDNGFEWQDHSLPEEVLKTNLNSVVYGDNQFKIVTAVGVILSSQDGENWTSDTYPSTLNSINDVAYGNGKFTAVGNNGQILICPSTSNAWTIQDIATEENLLAVACCNDLSVAVGGNGTIFVNNGTSNAWKKVDYDSTRSFTDVVYDEKNELFIISGSSQEVVIAKAILQQTVATTPEGLTAEDVVVAGVVATDLESTHELLEWNKIHLIDTGDNQITAQCGVNPPKTDLKIQLKL